MIETIFVDIGTLYIQQKGVTIFHNKNRRVTLISFVHSPLSNSKKCIIFECSQSDPRFLSNFEKKEP